LLKYSFYCKRQEEKGQSNVKNGKNKEKGFCETHEDGISQKPRRDLSGLDIPRQELCFKPTRSRKHQKNFSYAGSAAGLIYEQAIKPAPQELIKATGLIASPGIFPLQ